MGPIDILVAALEVRSDCPFLHISIAAVAAVGVAVGDKAVADSGTSAHSVRMRLF